MPKKGPNNAGTHVSGRPTGNESAYALTRSKYAAEFADRFISDFYRSTEIGGVVSMLGIGTYLGECTAEDDTAYIEAIDEAISSGINLIDTAINYRCQRSERAVGSALQRVVARGIPRDAVVVATKGGFLPLEDRPPSSRDEYRDYLKREFFSTGILTPDDIVAGGHSLAPSFLRYAISRSRANLGVQSIDLYYLHNPEQQLAAVLPASLRERLRAAFMVLEDSVSRGEIRAYGCATWTAFRVPPGAKTHLSIQDLVDVAHEVAGERHHFQAIQLPINLAMPEAVRAPTQQIGRNRELVPAVQVAESLGLSVFASASLMQAQLTRDLPQEMRALFPLQRTDAQRALAFVQSMPGVTSALVGTRSRQHVVENLEGAHRADAALR